jgi:hypothetical protein
LLAVQAALLLVLVAGVVVDCLQVFLALLRELSFG